ncbi:MAG TPA: DUF2190 family protein [Candidatus Latescibacteria bacterium]|nr:DUF2190 family protein [Candidatus Latescibacterota bacterium]
MAVDFGGQDITTVSGADLSAKRFYAVTMETTGKIALANSAGERCIGVLQNAPSADGKLARVRVGGVSKVVVAAAINPGVELSATTAGKFSTATAGHYVMGIALEASGADGDIIRVLLTNYQKNA